jgi:glycosyltransferase involved in cell wall biosynthesis
MKCLRARHHRMPEKIALSFFFPTYNEEDNIEETVARTIKTAEQSPYIDRYEIIIVDDGSSDRTPQIADSLADYYPQVRAVHHKKNRGYGAALRTGLSAARMEYVFFTDADLQFDIVEVNALLAHLSEAPVIIGYRAPRRDPLMRLVNAWGWNILNRLMFGLYIRDIDCAFKVFRTSFVQGLRLRSRGAMINAEILIRLSRQRVPIKQVPVSHLPRTAGSPTGAKLSVIVRAFRELLSLYSGELGSITQKEVLKFMTVGVINTLLDLGVYLGLTRATALFAGAPVEAKFFSFLVGTLSSFMLNRTWTFGIRTRPSPLEVARFYSVALVALGINTLSMYVFVRALGIHDLIALVLTTGLTFAFSYTLSKFWVFGKTARAPEAQTL